MTDILQVDNHILLSARVFSMRRDMMSLQRASTPAGSHPCFSEHTLLAPLRMLSSSSFWISGTWMSQYCNGAHTKTIYFHIVRNSVYGRMYRDLLANSISVSICILCTYKHDTGPLIGPVQIDLQGSTVQGRGENVVSYFKLEPAAVLPSTALCPTVHTLI